MASAERRPAVTTADVLRQVYELRTNRSWESFSDPIYRAWLQNEAVEAMALELLVLRQKVGEALLTLREVAAMAGDDF